ncbi:hypothetical protein [Chitinolyticbacter meiyuanensis]|uniref:hypothetical protein n=1 Tax=Chitinolyticbacter meiyuanensis TaxID=682798 RepID=UPI0011E5A79D|nr:hypothetical protein [Chitinolyticbacter meiyuanensis]
MTRIQQIAAILGSAMLAASLGVSAADANTSGKHSKVTPVPGTHSASEPDTKGNSGGAAPGQTN